MSKLGISTDFETTESIDANHMQIAKCKDRSDQSYRCILAVLKQCLDADLTIDFPIRLATQTQREDEIQARLCLANLSITCIVNRLPITATSTKSFYCIPFLQNHRFIGRTAKLNELERKLIVNQDCQKLALVGLGGVGKIQVALKFAYTVKERRPDYSVFWVPAVSGETFEQSYRDIAIKCSVALNPAEEDPKKSVRRYLNSGAAGKWLMIVDNSDDNEVLFGTSTDQEGIIDYLPESENGCTLFRTRHRESAVSLAQSEVIEVQEMDEGEAENFLERSLIQKDLLHDRAGTVALLHELAFLPLVIAQAAAYLNAMQISIQDYLSLLQSTEPVMTSLLRLEFRDDTRYKTSRNAVATTWLVSFDRIQRSDPAAADLLSFMSCIENKAIPESMLPAMESAEQMTHALGTLKGYAFVTPRDGEGNYDMHRLVHLATRVWLKNHGTSAECNAKVAIHLAEIFPLDDYAN